MIFKNEIPNQVIHVYSAKYPSKHVEEWHHHSCYQLIYAISGLIRVHTNDAMWILPSTYAVWMPPYIEHRLEILTDIEIRSVFVQPLARADLINYPLTSQVSPLLRELIINAATFNNNVLSHTREERVIELILDELRLLKKEPLYVPLPRDGKLKSACESILNKLYYPWQLADLANIMSVNERTITRYFRQETGLSFQEWLRRQRLLTGLSYLIKKHSITETALKVGYDNPSAFATMFKSYMGCTPSEYQLNAS
ncbi:AraC family transcriptional regulator [Vitreoscilla stercoraria]|uniref:AraC family transcriptional regulator n=1 Tax=Vitreoscilla stercoraria TaxID=61 RepID=UPI00036F50AE|nr:helix-turn-helix transcriptional regulator [Vitreoscilla stercoraria]